MLETETKRFEDLEFQQLERESRQDEEKETHTQQLLREIADYQRSAVTRKVTATCFAECAQHKPKNTSVVNRSVCMALKLLAQPETNPTWNFNCIQLLVLYK